jgi:hypothetical protein
MTIIYVLLVAHFIADFVCQSDWMAINKSKRWDALALHVFVYSAVLFNFTLWSRPVVPFAEAMPWMVAVLTFVAVNAAAHFVQDAITSRINSRLWFFKRADGIWAQAEYAMPKHGRTIVNPWIAEGGDRHWFFVAIGFDQLLHYVTLFVTASWLLR